MLPRRVLFALVGLATAAMASCSGTYTPAAFDASSSVPGDGSLLDSGVPDSGAADSGAADSDAADSDAADSDAATYVETVLADKPVAYWRLGETSGTTVVDRTGRGNDAVAANCTRGVPGAITGDSDTATSFNGSSSSVSSGADLAFVGNAFWSLEAWARPVGGSMDYQQILNKQDNNGGATRQGYALWIRPGMDIGIERYIDGVSVQPRAASLEPAVFTHLVATYNGATLSLYVNGLLANALPDTRPAKPQPLPFRIGAGENSSYFSGTVDDVAVYDTVLSPARILVHYRAAKRP
jgi:large repetitive protein